MIPIDENDSIAAVDGGNNPGPAALQLGTQIIRMKILFVAV